MFYSFKGIWRGGKSRIHPEAQNITRDPGFYCSPHSHFSCWSSWSQDGCCSPTDQDNQRRKRGREHRRGGSSLLLSVEGPKAPSSLPSVPPLEVGKEAATVVACTELGFHWPRGPQLVDAAWPSSSAPLLLF